MEMSLELVDVDPLQHIDAWTTCVDESWLREKDAWEPLTADEMTLFREVMDDCNNECLEVFERAKRTYAPRRIFMNIAYGSTKLAVFTEIFERHVRSGYRVISFHAAKDLHSRVLRWVCIHGHSLHYTIETAPPARPNARDRDLWTIYVSTE